MNSQVAEVSCRIKEMRNILQMEVEEVASSAGLPVEDYLKYENAEADIPISAIYSIASAMEIDPTLLLTGESPLMDTYTVVRAGKGISIDRNKDYSFESLAYNFKNRDMDPMIVELRATDAMPALVTHKGQEFNYVLEGTMTFLYRDKQIDLKKGDSVYFDPSVPHGQITKVEYAKFLTVINE